MEYKRRDPIRDKRVINKNSRRDNKQEKLLWGSHCRMKEKKMLHTNKTATRNANH